MSCCVLTSLSVFTPWGPTLLDLEMIPCRWYGRIPRSPSIIKMEGSDKQCIGILDTTFFISQTLTHIDPNDCDLETRRRRSNTLVPVH